MAAIETIPAQTRKPAVHARIAFCPVIREFFYGISAVAESGVMDKDQPGLFTDARASRINN
jgi:hypothetical protein